MIEEITSEEDPADVTPAAPGAEAEAEGHFSFAALAPVSMAIAAGEDKELAAQFTKWGLDSYMQLHTFKFGGHFQRHMSEQLLQDFLNDATVQGTWQGAGRRAGTVAGPFGAVTRPRLKEVPCTQTSLSFFDRLQDPAECAGDPEQAVVHAETSLIKQCMDIWHGGLTLSNKLQELLVAEESENFEMYTSAERKELLFRLFRHLVIGGGLCQYEDRVQPYYDATKKMYKELLTVRKKEETGAVEVVTLCYELKNFRSSSAALFPDKAAENNICLLFINPPKKTVTVYYNCWLSVLDM